MHQNFEGTTAVITGGSSGIGLAMARSLAAQGANIWLLARDPARLEKAHALVLADRRSQNQYCELISINVSDAEAVADATQRILQQAGQIDYLVNSAGISQPGNFLDLDLAAFRQIMDTNYFGTVVMTKAIAPSMIQRGKGWIVNLSSVAGFLGVWGYTAYGPSKYAIRGFSDALRAEMKPHGVGVSIVFPPDVETPMLEYERKLKPPELEALSSSMGALSAEAVAASILKGVQKGKYVILPDFGTKLVYHLVGWVGNGVYPIIDAMIAQARRKKSQ